MKSLARMQRYAKKTVLIVTAHPDDFAYRAAGVMYRLHRAGARVVVVCATKGTAGKGGDTSIRISHEIAAGRVVGCNDVEFLDFEDGGLKHCRELIEAIVERIRFYSPAAVFSYDPSVPFDQDEEITHSDHRAVGLSTVDAVYPAADTGQMYPQSGDPVPTPELWLFGTNNPSHRVWLSRGVMALKLEAIACHQTQAVPLMQRQARRMARRSGWWHIFYAEAFLVRQPKRFGRSWWSRRRDFA